MSRITVSDIWISILGGWRALTRRLHFPPRRWPQPRLSRLTRQNRYVAFLDLLGFASKVEHDLDGAIRTYEAIFGRIREMSRKFFPSLTIVVASDSVILSSETLVEILRACHYIQHFALFNDTLIRGGVAYDVHVHGPGKQNLYVVSPALIRAVRIEQTISRPCIALDSDIAVPNELYPYPGMHPLDRLIFFIDEHWVVSPFTRYWFDSALTRVLMMKDAHPEHRAKYEWFLNFGDSIAMGKRLVPEAPKYKEDPE